MKHYAAMKEFLKRLLDPWLHWGIDKAVPRDGRDVQACEACATVDLRPWKAGGPALSGAGREKLK